MKEAHIDFAGVVSRISEVATVSHGLELIQTSYQMDFVTYHLASTVVGEIDSPFVRTTYPKSWVSKYLLSGYVRIDPVVREGFMRQLPFDWRELEVTSEMFPFLEDARAHGLGAQGLSIPVSDKSGRRSILSLNSHAAADEWDVIVTAYRSQWLDLAQLIHAKAVFELHGENDPIPALTARERECLQWAALGKDYKDIALILNLSRHTARSYLKSARTKLGCGSITAATTLALKLRLISI